MVKTNPVWGRGRSVRGQVRESLRDVGGTARRHNNTARRYSVCLLLWFFVFFFTSESFFLFSFFFFFLRKSPTTALVPIGRVHASLLWAIKWIRSCLTVQALRTINDNSQNREVKYIYPPGYKYSQNGHRDHLLLLMQDRQSFNPVGQNSGSNNGIVYFCTSACPSPRRNDHWLESSAPDCQKTHPGKWQWWTTGHSRCCCSAGGGAVRRDTRDHACHIWYSAWAYLVEY